MGDGIAYYRGVWGYLPNNHGGRVIPVPGAKVGDSVEYGGLLGSCPVMLVKSEFSSEAFIARGGRIPAPIRSFTN